VTNLHVWSLYRCTWITLNVMMNIFAMQMYNYWAMQMATAILITASKSKCLCMHFTLLNLLKSLQLLLVLSSFFFLNLIVSCNRIFLFLLLLLSCRVGSICRVINSNRLWGWKNLILLMIPRKIAIHLFLSWQSKMKYYKCLVCTKVTEMRYPLNSTALRCAEYMIVIAINC